MADASDLERLWTVADVAKCLGQTEETVRRMLRRGELPDVRLSRKAGWRIRKSDVDAWFNALMEKQGYESR